MLNTHHLSELNKAELIHYAIALQEQMSNDYTDFELKSFCNDTFMRLIEKRYKPAMTEGERLDEEIRQKYRKTYSAIECIKHYRLLTQSTLKEAKETVEEILHEAGLRQKTEYSHILE